jgi:hypothetical protein
MNDGAGVKPCTICTCSFAVTVLKSQQLEKMGEKEGETVAIMLSFMQENALSANGRHHEIYLSDPRRVPPERLKTILRIPVS